MEEATVNNTRTGPSTSGLVMTVGALSILAVMLAAPEAKAAFSGTISRTFCASSALMQSGSGVADNCLIQRTANVTSANDLLLDFFDLPVERSSTNTTVSATGVFQSYDSQEGGALAVRLTTFDQDGVAQLTTSKTLGAYSCSPPFCIPPATQHVTTSALMLLPEQTVSVRLTVDCADVTCSNTVEVEGLKLTWGANGT